MFLRIFGGWLINNAAGSLKSWLVPVRQEAITSTSVDEDLWCHNASSGQNELLLLMYYHILAWHDVVLTAYCIQKLMWCTTSGWYRKTSNISPTLVGNNIVDHSDVVGASPVGAAPTTSSFSTYHLGSRDSAKTAARQYENLWSVEIWCVLY